MCQRDALGEGLAPEEGRGVACAVSAGLGDGLADAVSRPRWSSASRPDALAEPDAVSYTHLTLPTIYSV